MKRVTCSVYPFGDSNVMLYYVRYLQIFIFTWILSHVNLGPGTELKFYDFTNFSWKFSKDNHHHHQMEDVHC